MATQPHQQVLQQQQEQQQQLNQQAWRADRRVGIISIAMWFGTAIRVFPALTPWENIQSAIAITIMFLLVVLWPTMSIDSYMRWRVPAVSFLRVFLVALPYNFSTSVFDAIAPYVATGRLAVVANVFQTFLAVRIALLTFTSLGWRVPFRLHLLLQTVNVSLLVRYGLHPYCASKLLSSPELQAAAAAVHRGMRLSAMMFLPNVAISVPKGQYEQQVAFILFCWCILGWLLPTLLLLPDTGGTETETSPQPQQGHDWLNRQVLFQPSWLLKAFERGLATLQLPTPQVQQSLQQRRQQQPLPPSQRQPPDVAAVTEEFGDGDDDGDQLLPTAASFLLAWWIVLLAVWRVSCLAAGPY